MGVSISLLCYFLSYAFTTLILWVPKWLRGGPAEVASVEDVQTVPWWHLSWGNWEPTNCVKVISLQTIPSYTRNLCTLDIVTWSGIWYYCDGSVYLCFISIYLNDCMNCTFCVYIQSWCEFWLFSRVDVVDITWSIYIYTSLMLKWAMWSNVKLEFIYSIFWKPILLRMRWDIQCWLCILFVILY